MKYPTERYFAFIKTVNKTPPPGCEFKLKDKVTFVNEYGVSFKDLKVIGFDGNKIHLDSDCYWFPVAANTLTKQTG